MKFAYLKNGDVVQQAERYGQQAGKLTTSGPDAFISSFLAKNSNYSILLLSKHRRNKSFKSENTEAEVFLDGKTPLGKLFLRPIIFVKIAMKIVLFRPDRVLCGSTGSLLWVSGLYSLLWSVPLVHSRHNLIREPGRNILVKLTNALDLFFIKKAKGVVCHGPFLRKQIVELGVSERTVFEFDIGFSDLLAINDELDKSDISLANPHLITIVYIGRIESQKGIYDLLEAYKNMIAKFKKLKLVYVGVGSQLDALKSRAQREHIEDNIVIVGEVDRVELVSNLRKADVVVTPTRKEFPEGRCMSAMESLVMGVPVVAPDFGPFPFLIKTNKNGMLFRPNSIEDLQEKIESVLKSEDSIIRFKKGALEFGKRLIEPPMTFGDAVEKAFTL